MNFRIFQEMKPKLVKNTQTKSFNLPILRIVTKFQQNGSSNKKKSENFS